MHRPETGTAKTYTIKFSSKRQKEGAEDKEQNKHANQETEKKKK